MGNLLDDQKRSRRVMIAQDLPAYAEVVVHNGRKLAVRVSRAGECMARGPTARHYFQPLEENDSVGNELGLSSSAVRPNVSVSLQLAQLASASRCT